MRKTDYDTATETERAAHHEWLGCGLLVVAGIIWTAGLLIWWLV